MRTEILKTLRKLTGTSAPERTGYSPEPSGEAPDKPSANAEAREPYRNPYEELAYRSEQFVAKFEELQEDEAKHAKAVRRALRQITRDLDRDSRARRQYPYASALTLSDRDELVSLKTRLEDRIEEFEIRQKEKAATQEGARVCTCGGGEK